MKQLQIDILEPGHGEAWDEHYPRAMKEIELAIETIRQISRTELNL